LVKVGMAKDVRQRLESFRLGAPRGLVLRGSRKAPACLTRQVEKKIHAALAVHAVGREWFRTTPEHARTTATPILAAAHKAWGRFKADGFWSREYEPPPAPPEAMVCGLLEPEIIGGVLLEEEWIEALRAWRPQLPQAAAFVAIDLPVIFAKMGRVTVASEADCDGTSGRFQRVEIITDRWFAANDLLEAAIAVPEIERLLSRWERRRGVYEFEVPSHWVAMQLPALPDEAPRLAPSLPSCMVENGR
jgi:hypothetical protein